MKQLSIENRSKISAFAKSGFSERQIVNKMLTDYGILTSKGTVHRVLMKEKHFGTIERKIGSGRLRKTSVRLDRQIVRLALKNRKQSLGTLSTDFEDLSGVKLSQRSIKNVLKLLALEFIAAEENLCFQRQI